MKPRALFAAIAAGYVSTAALGAIPASAGVEVRDHTACDPIEQGNGCPAVSHSDGSGYVWVRAKKVCEGPPRDQTCREIPGHWERPR